MAGREVEQARAMQEAWRLRLRGQLTARFYEALAATERVKASEELAANAADSAKIARELRNLGILDEPDIRAADVEAQRAALGAVEARQKERRARAELAALFNEESMGELAGEVGELPRLERERLWEQVREMSPEVTLAMAEKAKAAVALRQARAALVPDLRVRGGLRNNREWGDVPGGRPVGVEGIFDVGIDIPLFNRQQGNIRAAKAGVEKMEWERARTERQLRVRFASAWQRYETARARAARYRDEMIPSARQAFQMYQRNFRGMQGPYTRVLDAQRTYFALQGEYFEILSEGWRAAAELQSLLLAGEER
jgi:cobalt-zinc-cadmium efflux system outer membrane protein